MHDCHFAVAGWGWQTCNYAVHPLLVRVVVDHFGEGEPTVDCFATAENKRFAVHWSREDSAWQHSWSWKRTWLLWMNPPFDVIGDVVRKICADKARAILVVPEWRSRPWWKRLQDIIVARKKLPRTNGLFLREGKTAMRAPRWDVWEFLVDGGLEGVILDGEKTLWNLHAVPGVDDHQVA